jgi:hypothetical protein
MHGAIYTCLREFAESRTGLGGWQPLLESLDLGYRCYLASGTYPDSEAVRILAALSSSSQEPLQLTIAAFGEHMVPSLLKLYGALVRPEWRTLDLLEHTEGMIHRIIRTKNTHARPPDIAATRESPHDITLLYTSSRQLCALARGIILGVAKHYQEHIIVVEPSCMLRGDRVCKFVVHKSSSSIG